MQVGHRFSHIRLRGKGGRFILRSMVPNKIKHAAQCWSILFLIDAAASAVFSANQLADPPVPRINEVQREFLSRLARRTVRDAMLDRPAYTPDFVPEELSKLQAEVAVRLRQGGFVCGIGAAFGTVATAVGDAAAAAAKMPMPDRSTVVVPAELLIEIEVAGTAQELPADLDWLKSDQFREYVEPGMHGLVFVRPGGDRRICPSDVFTSEIPLDEGLKALAQHFHHDPQDASRTRLRRFRTVHWYEASAGAGTVLLERGMKLVPVESVTEAELGDAISRLAEYIAYRQLPSGLFTYEFEVGADRYSDENNIVRQIGVAALTSQYARLSGKSSAVTSADRAIAFHLQGLANLPGVDGAGFIATADGRNKLGATALLAMALLEHPQSERYAETRGRLVNGILWLQQPSGMFVTAFPPAQQLNAQDYFPGEALLVLAEEYDRQPSERILKAFNGAMDFYGEYFKRRRSPAFAAWQVQAFARMATATKRDDFARFAFELADWMIAQQLTTANCRWPDLIGGIDSGDGPTAAAGLYLESLADALNLARRMKDGDRVKRYEPAVRGLARFVLQLQIRPEEAYFARSQKDTVGGIRAAPTVARVRIDHCAHALVGLAKATQALFPQAG